MRANRCLATLAYACQGEGLEISCDNGTLIHIINANYGRFDNELCPSGDVGPNFQCDDSGTRDFVTEM